MTRPPPSILALALLAGCAAKHSLVMGQPCPCAPGWSCDTAANTCVAPAVDAGTDGADASAEPHVSTALGSCACDMKVRTNSPGFTYVTVSRDCFCASPYGYLCRDYDQVPTLCSRPEIPYASWSGFVGCKRHYVSVTIGSAEKGRPTYATVRFEDNSFAGVSFEADLLCNNLPADEVNDEQLRVVTDGYIDPDPTCGADDNAPQVCRRDDDGGVCPPSTGPCGDVGQRCCFNSEGKTCFTHGACVREPAGSCELTGFREVCVDCGGKGQPCCDLSPRCGSGLVCEYPTDGGSRTAGTPTCTDSCGGEGSRCCEDSACRDGLLCSQIGTCTRTHCGNPGEACCAYAGIEPCTGACNDAGICGPPPDDF